MLKKIFNYGSTGLLILIIVVLLVPSWRVSFQGWFQGLWMSDLEFSATTSETLPPDVKLWNLQNGEGEELLFNAFDGKPIILTFWATWCPACRTELGELKELQNEFGRKINFVSVSEEPMEKIKSSGLSSTYDFLYATNKFPSFFKISFYPTLCIISKEGELIFKASGAGDLNSDKNRSFLEGLI